MRVVLLVALIAACGDRRAVEGDAGSDGGIDSVDAIDADPDAPGPVTVQVLDKNRMPVAGIYVLFDDGMGHQYESSTDEGGSTVATRMYRNSSVTAIRARGMSYAIVTVTAVEPNDVVTLIGASPEVASSEDPFSQRGVPMPSADLVASPVGATKSGSIATFTTVAPHELAAGDHVIVANVGAAGYNGTWTVASAPSTTTFTADLGNGNLPASGTVTLGATATKAVRFTLSYPANASAHHYVVHSLCGTMDVGTATSPQLALPVACTSAPMTFEVHAKSAAGATLAWTQRTNVNVTAGGSTTITDTWHATAQLAATYTNPTAEVTSIAVARFSPYLRGVAVGETSGSAMATTTLMVPAALSTRATVSTLLTCPSGTSPSCISTTSGAASQRITQVVTGTAASYALDIGATLLPWVEAVYVPATTTLEITTTGTASYDVFEANLRYTRGQAIYTWRVFGPVAQSVVFPVLPSTAPGNPTIQPGDVMSSYQAFIGESDAINGYRHVVQNPFEALNTCDASANPSLKAYPGATNRISQWN